MFASKSVAEHVVRGVVGIGAFVASGRLAATEPIIALLLVPVALVALRGCPTCWTVGLVQTIVASARGRTAQGACADGACAARSRDDASGEAQRPQAHLQVD